MNRWSKCRQQQQQQQQQQQKQQKSSSRNSRTTTTKNGRGIRNRRRTDIVVRTRAQSQKIAVASVENNPTHHTYRCLIIFLN